MKIEITGISDTNKKYLQVILASVLTIGVAIGTVKTAIDARFVNETVQSAKNSYVNKVFREHGVSFSTCGNEYIAVLGDASNDQGFLSQYVNAVDVKNNQLVPLDYNVKENGKFVYQVKTEANGYTVEFKDDKIILNGKQCVKGLESDKNGLDATLRDYVSYETLNKASRARYQFLQANY